MKFNIAVFLIGTQSSASASDTGVLHHVHRSIKERHLATNETSAHREQRQERLEKFREEWAEGKGEAHHGGNRTKGHINKNVTAFLAQQVVQPSLKKEEEEDPLFGCPEDDIVDCDDGVLKSDDSISCAAAAACDGECCVGTDACTGFTGRVCKDGNSCMGQEACKDAEIDLVVGGCRGDQSGYLDNGGVCEFAEIKKGVIRGCIGEGACFGAGRLGGHVGRIKDGCVGGLACGYLGLQNGYVGFVDNGCVGDESCRGSGLSGGRVGFIRNACKGGGACRGAGGNGFVGFIENSCTGLDACFYTGSFTGDGDPGDGIGSIEHSCHGEDSCAFAAAGDGEITSIKWSCKGESSCYGAARGGGYIDGINKACFGDSACFEAARYSGNIDGISKACLSDFSCFYSARGTSFAARDGGSIDSGIKNCVCDTCAGAFDDTSLPDECGDKLDFGDLFKELNDIIKSKIDP